MPLVVIDFETSGLDPAADRIVEFGLALFADGKCQLSTGGLVYPETLVPDEVVKIHGITNDDLRVAPTFADRYYNLEAFLRKSVPVAYNADFDRSFLLAEIGRVFRRKAVERAKRESNSQYPAIEAMAELIDSQNLPPAFQPTVEWVDPLVWVRYFYKFEKSKKLTDMCKKLGVSLDGVHRAMNDARATGELLFKLADRIPAAYGQMIDEQKKLAIKQEHNYRQWAAKQAAKKLVILPTNKI